MVLQERTDHIEKVDKFDKINDDTVELHARRQQMVVEDTGLQQHHHEQPSGWQERVQNPDKYLDNSLDLEAKKGEAQLKHSSSPVRRQDRHAFAIAS